MTMVTHAVSLPNTIVEQTSEQICIALTDNIKNNKLLSNKIMGCFSNINIFVYQ
jgi:hypothetical protein